MGNPSLAGYAKKPLIVLSLVAFVDQVESMAFADLPIRSAKRFEPAAKPAVVLKAPLEACHAIWRKLVQAVAFQRDVRHLRVVVLIVRGH